jgi:hypothetical protein
MSSNVLKSALVPINVCVIRRILLTPIVTMSILDNRETHKSAIGGEHDDKTNQDGVGIEGL